MNHAYFCHGGCRAGYKLQFDFSKSTGREAGKERGRRVSNGEKKKRWGRRASASRLGFLSVSAGYQLAIRALIAFECNVAENFIWARQHEGARAGMRWDRGREGGGGQARESGSRCDFVSTLRTPSRVPPLAVSPRHLHIHRSLANAIAATRERASRRSNLFTTLRIAALR